MEKLAPLMWQGPLNDVLSICRDFILQ